MNYLWNNKMVEFVVGTMYIMSCMHAPHITLFLNFCCKIACKNIILFIRYYFNFVNFIIHDPNHAHHVHHAEIKCWVVARRWFNMKSEVHHALDKLQNVCILLIFSHVLLIRWLELNTMYCLFGDLNYQYYILFIKGLYNLLFYENFCQPRFVVTPFSPYDLNLLILCIAY